MKTIVYKPLGRPAPSSFLTVKRTFRGLGYFFAFVAILANASDAFNIAQAIVLPFFFPGLDLGIGLIAMSVVASVAVSLLYIYQEGKSVVNGSEKLPGKFKQFLAWWRGEGNARLKPQKPLTTKQKLASFAVELFTSSISFLVSTFWALSVFAGVVALTGAMGFAPGAGVFIIAGIAAAAQFSASFFQEGSNFMQSVRKDLKHWFGLEERAPSKAPKRVKLTQAYRIKLPIKRRSPATNKAALARELDVAISAGSSPTFFRGGSPAGSVLSEHADPAFTLVTPLKESRPVEEDPAKGLSPETLRA